MSTTSEMERMPASFRRAIIQAGVRRLGSTPRTIRVTKTEAPTRPRTGASSAIVTGKSLDPLSAAARAGSRNAAPVACAYSRATPRIENA